MTDLDEKKEISDRQIAAVPKGRMIILGGEFNEPVDMRSTPNRVQGEPSPGVDIIICPLRRDCGGIFVVSMVGAGGC